MGFFSNTLKGLAGGGLFANSSFRKGAKDFALGKEEQNYQQSLLSPEQQTLAAQRQQAIAGPGAGGAYGTTADYYRDLLNPNSQTVQQLQAPELRKFREDIIPGVGEEFAGMGSGALSSSGFRNAVSRAGVDLSERLGMLRANARMQGAQGLQGLGQQGLQSETENILRPATEGFINQATGAAGKAGVQYLTGGMG